MHERTYFFLNENIILADSVAAVLLVLFGFFWYMKLHHAFVEHTSFIIHGSVLPLQYDHVSLLVELNTDEILGCF